jgi:hypothetical protein
MGIYKVNEEEIITYFLKKESASVLQVGYSEASRVLVVVYKRGDAYSYHPIMPEVYKELLGTLSIGGYIAVNIVKNPRVTSQKLPPKDEAKKMG